MTKSQPIVVLEEGVDPQLDPAYAWSHVYQLFLVLDGAIILDEYFATESERLLALVSTIKELDLLDKDQEKEIDEISASEDEISKKLTAVHSFVFDYVDMSAPTLAVRQGPSTLFALLVTYDGEGVDAGLFVSERAAQKAFVAAAVSGSYDIDPDSVDESLADAGESAEDRYDAVHEIFLDEGFEVRIDDVANPLKEA